MAAMKGVVSLFAGNGTGARVKRFESSKAANDTDIERLEAELEEAGIEFSETADPSKLRSIEAKLVEAQTLRKRIAEGLAKAEADLAAEQAAEAAKLLEQKHARLRAEAAQFGEKIVEKLIELGKLLGRHEGLVDQLPQGLRYTLWPPDYCAAANAALEKSSPPQFVKTGGLTRATNPPREIELRLVCPMEKPD